MLGEWVISNGQGLNANNVVALCLALLAIFFLTSGMRRRQRERAGQAKAAGARLPSTDPAMSSKEKLRGDLEILIGELQDLSRKISAEIDTRFAKLEAAIRDADRRIAVLNRLTRQAGAIDETLQGEPEDHDTRYAVVYELADAGFSSMEIARDLGKTPGEIELILNLRRTAQP